MYVAHEVHRADGQLPDFVKQSLQHETYSKVQGIKNVARRLETSLSRATTDVLAAQIEIASSGSLSEETQSRLERVEGTATFTDNRNWELLPDSLGLDQGSIKAGTALGPEIGEKWVKAWSAILLAFGRICAGQKVDVAPELAEGEEVRRSYCPLPALVLTSDPADRGGGTSCGRRADQARNWFRRIRSR